MEAHQVDRLLELVTKATRPYLIYVGENRQDQTDDELRQALKNGRVARDAVAKIAWAIDTALACDQGLLDALTKEGAEAAAARRRIDREAHKAQRRLRAQQRAASVSKPTSCADDGCARSAVFFADGSGWCKRHVPPELRPTGKV